MKSRFLSKSPPSDLARCLTRGPILLPVLTLAALAATSAAPLYAATFTVTKTADTNDGTCDTDCSLREAIVASNADLAGTNVITFDLPTSAPNTVFTIVPTTALPTITQPVIIDGYTQNGATDNTIVNGNNAKILVELAGRAATDGTSANFNGLMIGAGNTLIKGLAINRFNNGIVFGVPSGAPTSIVGCFIGTDASGAVRRGNTIGIAAATNGTLVIGTALAADRNVISGNAQAGVGFGSAGANASTVKNSYIGTNAAGTAAIANGNGVAILNASGIQIGGNGAFEPNLISGNTGTDATQTGYGIVIGGASATGNTIYGNLIGTNFDGSAAIGNSTNGILINGGSNNLIGGPAAGQGNVISGTTAGSGVRLIDASNNKIQGNRIGTNAEGTAALGNFNNGISLAASIPGTSPGSPNNVIGGANAGEGNVIAGNGHLEGEIKFGNGVLIRDAGSTGNKVQGNLIGVDRTGAAKLGNVADGVVLFSGASNNIVGGNTAQAGNVISGNDFGISIVSSNGTTVQGNLIGTNAAGTAAIGNVASGIGVFSADKTVIGGLATGEENLISGNDFGIGAVGSTNTRIQGNLIGTDITGTKAIGNTVTGIQIRDDAAVTQKSAGNLIGGTADGAGNVISGNSVVGVSLSNSSDSTVQGNLIGTDITGTKAIPNASAVAGTLSGAGVAMQSGGSNNLIGGTSAGARNVISGNATFGVGIVLPSVSNTVQGNLIGTQIDGVTPLSNGNANIAIQGSSGNTIGGTTANAGNTIAYGAAGVALVAVPFNNTAIFPKSNAILSNSIFGNLFTGIALTVDPTKPVPFSRTPNDVGDGDDGSNRLQNFPVLTSAANAGGQTRVAGTLNSTANGTFTIQFFSNPPLGPNQVAQAATLLGQINVTTDALGNASFSLPAPSAVANGQIITATATNATTGDTSEISDPVTVGNAGSVQFSTTAYSVNENAGTATITVTRSNGASGPLTVNYATANGTATSGQDYTSTVGTLNFAMGETSKTFAVPITDDAINEPNETIVLNLTTTTAGTQISAPGSALLTIVDNDAAPTISVNDVRITEGNSGSTDAIFTVSLSAPSGQTITVNAATADGTATAGSDYTARSGTLSFAPGEKTKTVAIAVSGDTAIEPDETFTLTLSSPTNATLATGAAGSAVGTATIVNDDFNTAPVANSQTVTTNEDGAVAITLSASDKETPAANLTYRLVSGPQNGTLSGTAPNIAYTPNANFNGSDSFTYVVNDGLVDSNVATVTLQVLAVNDAPVANSQQLRVDNATPQAITLTASDIDSTDLTYIIGNDLPGSTDPNDKGSFPKFGKLSGIAPNLVYTPNPGFRGRDQFTFYAFDGQAVSNQARVEIEVSGAAGINAADDSFTLIIGGSDQKQQTGVTLLTTGVFKIDAPGVLANDRNPVGTKLQLRVVVNPKKGRFQLRQDGSLFYIPIAGNIGLDELTYALSDGRTTATARVRLNIVDRRAPELAFDSPRNGATVKTLTEIKGRARDRQSGINGLTLLWQRFDGKFWNGSAWTATATELPLEFAGVDWKYTGKLPAPGDDPATDLINGRYDLRVTATDKSGNINRVINKIAVANVVVEPPATSTVRLSAAGASATSDAIELRFTGALDAASASNAMNYVVTINGEEIEAGVVNYAENVVTISGFDNDLAAGDEIELEISGLKDAGGKTLAAGTINLTAR